MFYILDKKILGCFSLCWMKPGDILKFIPKLLMKYEGVLLYDLKIFRRGNRDKFYIHFACLTVLNFIILFVTAISMFYKS